MGAGADPRAGRRPSRGGREEARARAAGARSRPGRPHLSAPVEGRAIEPAPAKINLDLVVLGRRDDGLHELDSLVAFADLADRVAVAPSFALELVVSGPEASAVPADPSNLVVRAARLLADAAGRPPAVRLHLDKHLPVAAGIGGGSADAAAALRALNRLWRLAWSLDRLEALGRELGADVPVCVRGRTVRMRGVGERLEPVALEGPLHLLLVNPRVQMPTGPVFRELRAPLVDPASVRADLAPDERLRRGWNDLEPPAVRLEPVIGQVLDAIRTLPGARVVRMSGSGATCFGWFATADEAAAGAALLSRRRPGWWIHPVIAGEEK